MDWRDTISKLTTMRGLERKTLLRVARDLAILFVVVTAIGLYQSRHLPTGQAPAFSLSTNFGNEVSSTSMTGHTTLLVFWAPWCTVCHLQADNIARVMKFVSDDVELISIATAYDDVAEVEAYLVRHDVRTPVLLDDRRVARAYKVGAFPTSFIIDDEGKISAAIVGYTSTFGLWWRLITA